MSSKKLDAAIDALVDRWPSCPSTSLRVGSAATGWGCRSLVIVITLQSSLKSVVSAVLLMSASLDCTSSSVVRQR